MTVRIDYDPETVEAVLSTTATGRFWDITVRTVRETSDEARSLSDTELRLPWWTFIVGRRALAFQVATNDIPVEFTARASDRLKDANDRVELLTNVQSTPELSDADLLEALKRQGFVRPLKPFQTRNLRKLLRLPVGATFSVPGSGKTTEALAFFAFFRQKDARLLVVAPKNAFAAWEEQLAECLGPDLKFVRLIGGRNAIEWMVESIQPSLMLVTYEQFPTVSTILARYLARSASFMFLDESHRIKGGVHKVRANAILRVAPVADFKLILSGTPLPNAASDLLPQFKFIAPELVVDDEKVIDEIKPFFVRTTKKDLGLRAPERVLMRVPMAEEQRGLYELLKSELARSAQESLRREQRRALRSIGRSAVRLLQFTSNPSLLIGKVPQFDELLGQVIEEGDSPKLDWVCRRARYLARKNHKVIIWSSFVENVELLAERLSDLGADYIHGGVETSSDAEADSRETRIARFHNDPHAMVLVANPAACGEGISLHTVCDHAIYIDRNYNAAQYLQSEDRIHRIGSDNQKFVEIVVCPDSIDDSVHSRLQTKIARMAEALDDEGLSVSPISLDADELNPDDDDVLDLLKHLGDPTKAAA
ncbi:MAG: DEAD/DEAH box helicase [Alphaproteobacteria bacterium]|nr:DEAD/DEAH box helicase [Alphaproteobacteria bacterium]